MEWHSKVPSWELTELQQNVESSMVNTINFGSNGDLGNQIGGIDCSVDLKLGGSGEFRPQNHKSKDQYRMSNKVIMPSSSSSPAKRAKPLRNSSQNASCSVDGCKADLSNSREYHRRHKVCEVHSKTPVVRVGGQEQRFCQQCSRFHSLVEFDEIKRSCRKRLDGHNRRRRKSHPESTNPDGLFLGHQGGKLLAYPQIFQSPIPETNWTGIVKFADDGIYGRQQHLHVMNNQTPFAGSIRHEYRKDNQFSFLTEGEPAFTRSAAEVPTCQPLNTPSSEERSSSKFFSGELTQVIDYDCALSLLSPSDQTLSINMGQILPAEKIPMDQPVVSTMQHYSLNSCCNSQVSSSVLQTRFSCSTVEEQVATILVSDIDANLQCQATFHVGGEGSSEEAPHSLPFSWH